MINVTIKGECAECGEPIIGYAGLRPLTLVEGLSDWLLEHNLPETNRELLEWLFRHKSEIFARENLP